MSQLRVLTQKEKARENRPRKDFIQGGQHASGGYSEMYSFHINVNSKCYLTNLLNCERNIIIIKITIDIIAEETFPSQPLVAE